jgi:hypothetical protein
MESPRAAPLLNYQITRLPNENRLPAGVFASELGFKATGFAAGTAIVNAIFAQADFIETLAQAAIFVAGAASFGLVANHADEFLSHSGRLSLFRVSGNRTMVDDLAIE